eukprot:CAMPEP_0118934792 /NCGR_PEP_ID=MMETSP1169-20130426/14181_1 /TAXON_ID=36882 /ORGANISM="Pyramimonas obovata, Strain CCMP722" /LENGTH=107 /DNA_ID=CAMNT_0006877729 /DNA_START=119 /DNA_END=442 /DNA_ORIENTATION=+
MGKKKASERNGAEKETLQGPDGSEVTTEATAEQKALIKKVAQAAKKDAADLQAETADQVRERLAKSQSIAREIMATLKLERQHTLNLEAVLKANNIEIPARPTKDDE